MEQTVKISQFLDEEGRILQLPRKQKPRYAILQYLAEKFAPDAQYTELEVNALCGQWSAFNDPILLRRELVDSGLVCRERNGSRYWRAKDAAPADGPIAEA